MAKYRAQVVSVNSNMPGFTKVLGRGSFKSAIADLTEDFEGQRPVIKTLGWGFAKADFEAGLAQLRNATEGEIAIDLINSQWQIVREE